MVEINKLKQYRDKVIQLKANLFEPEPYQYDNNLFFDRVVKTYNEYTLFIDNINKEIKELEKPSKILRG